MYNGVSAMPLMPTGVYEKLYFPLSDGAPKTVNGK